MKPLVIQLKKGSFTIRLGATFITLLMLSVLLGLGAWQLKRLVWKENLIQTIETHIHQAPIDINSAEDKKDVDYTHAKATGNYIHDKEFYLVAISLNGQGGYHVLTPFHLENGHYLLVDRGFVPYDKKAPETREEGQIDGQLTVTGLLRRPQHFWFEPQSNIEKNEWYGIDLKTMAERANIVGFMPYILEADATANPGGYPIGGQTHISLPNNHLSYALTWFGLALALIVVYFVSNYKAHSKS